MRRHPKVCIGFNQILPPTTFPGVDLARKRSHRQFDTRRITAPKVVVEINPADAAARMVLDGEVVRMFNQQGEVRIPVRITLCQQQGTVAMPKGVWRRHIANKWTSNARSRLVDGSRRRRVLPMTLAFRSRRSRDVAAVVQESKG